MAVGNRREDLVPELLREEERPLLSAGRCARAVSEGRSPEEWCSGLGMDDGVGGWILRTLPAALLCWLRHPADYRAAVEEVISLGGDADTTGAITGALAGATVGESGIPEELLRGILDWPRSVGWIRRLAGRVAQRAGGSGAGTGPLPLFWPGLLPRNLLFLFVVLAHGFRRLSPPY